MTDSARGLICGSQRTACVRLSVCVSLCSRDASVVLVNHRLLRPYVVDLLQVLLPIVVKRLHTLANIGSRPL